MELMDGIFIGGFLGAFVGAVFGLSLGLGFSYRRDRQYNLQKKASHNNNQNKTVQYSDVLTHNKIKQSSNFKKYNSKIRAQHLEREDSKIAKPNVHQKATNQLIKNNNSHNLTTAEKEQLLNRIPSCLRDVLLIDSTEFSDEPSNIITSLPIGPRRENPKKREFTSQFNSVWM